MDIAELGKALLENSVIFVLLLGAVIYVYRHFAKEVKELKEKIEKLEGEKEAKNDIILKINGEYHTLLQDMTTLARELTNSFDDFGAEIKGQILELANGLKSHIKMALLEHDAINKKK